MTMLGVKLLNPPESYMEVTFSSFLDVRVPTLFLLYVKCFRNSRLRSHTNTYIVAKRRSQAPLMEEIAKNWQHSQM